jgi:hypothetical protein
VKISELRNKLEIPLEVLGMIGATQIVAPIMWIDLPKIFRRIKFVEIENIVVKDHDLLVLRCEDSNKNTIEIVIKKANQQIIQYRDNGTFSYGSAVIGIALVGWFGTVIALPILIPVWLIRIMLSWISGMNWHRWLIWLKIKKQLPKEIVELVNVALKGH